MPTNNIQENISKFCNYYFLQFCTPMDRIPVMGFTKPIEVFFTHENKYPKASTCGLTLTLPYNVSTDMLIYSVKNGGTFGDH